MIKLVRTCEACPEQYDAYLDGEVVGYLRLRHGTFYVECPGSGGVEVHRGTPHGDGCFLPDERDRHLTAACLAILRWVEKRRGRGAAVYEVVARPDL